MPCIRLGQDTPREACPVLRVHVGVVELLVLSLGLHLGLFD